MNKPDMLPQDEAFTSYKPSAFYFRQALRSTDSSDQLRRLGLTLVDELELLKAWVRERGLIPPKWNVTRTEAREKGWDSEPPKQTSQAGYPFSVEQF